MKTEIVKVFGENPDIQALEYCGAVIREGGLVAFPTETVYGLGANAFDDCGVRSIFTAKNRPCDNPLIVHIDDYKMLQGVANFNNVREKEYFTRLGQAYWPGPLTMIVGKDEKIPVRILRTSNRGHSYAGTPCGKSFDSSERCADCGAQCQRFRKTQSHAL